MELFIELHDHADVVHNWFQFEFGSQDTLNTLRNKISSVWSLDSEYQNLSIKNRYLLVGPSQTSLQSFGLKNGSKVIVKHSLVDKWVAYLVFCENAKNPENARFEQIEHAHEAIANSEELEESGFLTVYPTYIEKWIDTIGQMFRIVDIISHACEQAATTFFTKMYPNSEIDIYPKQDGTRTGIIVTVSCNNEETNYYMKTYHHAGPENPLQKTPKPHLPDFREMFAYRLLELLGVGPRVFFPYYNGSTQYHFICTKEVDEFKEIDKIEDDSVQKKIVVEGYLLALILGIGDLNDGNVGSNRKKTLSIVDFYIPNSLNSPHPKILDDYKYKRRFRGVGKANEILIGIGHEERMKITKDALLHWSQINSVTNDIIGVEMKELREHGIVPETAVTKKSRFVSIHNGRPVSPYREEVSFEVAIPQQPDRYSSASARSYTSSPHISRRPSECAYLMENPLYQD